MFKKLFTFIAVLVLAFVMIMPQAQAKYGLVKWYFGVYDENNQLVTATTTVNVYTAGTTTNATIYSDEDATAKSNPWDITDGEIVFYSSATSLDIQVNAGSRGAIVTSITPVSAHRIELPIQGVGVQRSLPLPILLFADYNTGDLVDTDETPGIEKHNLGVALEWSDGEAAEKATTTFRIPYDYLSGGYFRVWADEATGGAGTTGRTALDFEVLVNRDNTAFDAAATDQTPVALLGNPGSPEELTLTVTTDFASLAAGDLVTFKLWRDDTTYTGTSSTEVYYVEFVYTAKQ